MITSLVEQLLTKRLLPMRDRQLKSLLRILANLQKKQLYEILLVDIDEIWSVFETKGTIHGLLYLSDEHYNKLISYCLKLMDVRANVIIENYRINDLVQFDPLFSVYGRCIGEVTKIEIENNLLYVEIINAGEKQERMIVECSPDEVKFCGIGRY